jgi:hypothetical protein
MSLHCAIRRAWQKIFVIARSPKGDEAISLNVTGDCFVGTCTLLAMTGIHAMTEKKSKERLVGLMFIVNPLSRLLPAGGAS